MRLRQPQPRSPGPQDRLLKGLSLLLPAPLVRPLDQARRDVQCIVDRLQGRRSDPVATRHSAPSRSPHLEEIPIPGATSAPGRALAQLQRDLSMFTRGLRGIRAPATIPRPPKAPQGVAPKPTIGERAPGPASAAPSANPGAPPREEPRPPGTSPQRTLGKQALAHLVTFGEARFPVPDGSTILEAAEEADVDLPFSCTLGGCGACIVRLTRGEVDMETPNCLSDEEREDGFILTCVSRPLGPCTIEEDL